MLAYGETNLKQYTTYIIDDNIKEVNKKLIWFLMENIDVQLDRCEYEEGTRWTGLRVYYLKEDKGENVDE